MGMWSSIYIFQVKLDELLKDIEEVKTYIDDILILIRKISSKRIEHLKVIFARLRAEGLEFNAPKCSFGLK